MRPLWLVTRHRVGKCVAAVEPKAIASPRPYPGETPREETLIVARERDDAIGSSVNTERDELDRLATRGPDAGVRGTVGIDLDADGKAAPYWNLGCGRACHGKAVLEQDRDQHSYSLNRASRWTPEMKDRTWFRTGPDPFVACAPQGRLFGLGCNKRTALLRVRQRRYCLHGAFGSGFGLSTTIR